MIREWWAEFWWSRTHKTQAAFRRGFALGFILALLLVSMFGCAAGPVERLANACLVHGGKPNVSVAGDAGKVDCR